MWQVGSGGQGGSQIEAPVLVFDQEDKRLTARAETPGVADTVHAVLADASSARNVGGSGKAEVSAAASLPVSKTNAKDAAKPVRQGVARITSSLMVYSDLQRQADFSGGVRVVDGSGEMRGQQATVFLRLRALGRRRRRTVRRPVRELGWV